MQLKVMWSILLVTSLLLGTASALQAQSYTIHIKGLEKEPLLYNRFAIKVVEKQAIDSTLASIQSEAWSLGYFKAHIDSLKFDNDTLYYVCQLGPQYQFINLDISDIPIVLKEETLKYQVGNGKMITSAEWALYCQKILKYLDENGYPFASVSLRGLQEKAEGRVDAKLVVDVGELRTIDSIIWSEDIRIKPYVLYRTINIYPQSVFRAKDIKLISRRLKTLPYFAEMRPSEINFNAVRTELKLHLKERPSNQVNALLGIQPGQGANDKINLTVDANFDFKNLLGYGEAMTISYQNLQKQSPKLTTYIKMPYLLATPFGAELGFNLYQYGLHFRQTQMRVGGNYQINPEQWVTVYFQSDQNRLIGLDSQQVVGNGGKNLSLDFRTTGIGIQLNYTNLEHPRAAKYGWYFDWDVLGGWRQIIKNTAIETWLGSAFYDTLGSKTTSLTTRLRIERFHRLSSWLSLQTSVQCYYLMRNQYLQNELKQIGGSQTLRGFDEHVFWVSEYANGTIALRAHFDDASMAYVFSDNAWLKSPESLGGFKGFYHGIGLGLQLENTSGVFKIEAAIGKKPLESFVFRQAKIHIGYSAFF